MNSNFLNRLNAGRGIRNAEGQRLSQKKQSLFPIKTTQQQWRFALLNFLTGEQTLSIKEKGLKRGGSQWIVYDSRSDTRRVFESEAAVRSWLEQRYYR